MSERSEMAFEEYKKLPKWKGKIFMKDEETCFNDGFLAGLKAGRLEWHDLRKDPNDLPNEFDLIRKAFGVYPEEKKPSCCYESRW